VLVETCNGLARFDRNGAAAFVKACYADPRFDVVSVGRPLLDAALDLYAIVNYKEWGLTDCISSR
jgi:uncharacterized protein